MPPAGHPHQRHGRVDGNAAGLGQHRRQRAGRAFDRVDAGSGDRTGDRHRRPVARQPADGDLRVGRLRVQLAGDRLAQPVGRLARGLDLAGVGNEDIALPVHLHFGQRADALPGVAQKRVVLDVLEDGDGQRVAGLSVSDPTTPAFLKASEKPNEGSTAVARVTRGLTVTMKASPSFRTEPAKISRLFGPGAAGHSLRPWSRTQGHPGPQSCGSF